MKLQLGTVYVTNTRESEFPLGTRVEFIGGLDDDVFCSGNQYDWLGSQDVMRSSDQSPLEYTEEMQFIKGKCLGGADPTE